MFDIVAGGGALLLVAAGAFPVRAEEPQFSWRETGGSLALLTQGRVIWQFNHLRDKQEQGVPYFHPMATVAGDVLTDLRPADHLWHRGLRFAWMMIDGVEGYWTWPEGRQRWPDQELGETDITRVKVVAAEDFSARFELDLDYHAPGKPPVLTERRTVSVSVPDQEGRYRIDWHGVFTAGRKDVVLDRTPIPGEPGGKPWGGYAALQWRLPPKERMAAWRLCNSEGAELRLARSETVGFESLHGRPARWMDVILEFLEGRTAGVTLLDHPGNPRHPAVWHVRSMPNEIIQSPLFYGPYTLKAGESLTFRYRILIRSGQAEAARLESEWRDFSTAR